MQYTTPISHTMNNNGGKLKFNQKIQQMTKTDKKSINDIIINTDFTNSWVKNLETVDREPLIRSLSHILNATFDHIPSEVINSNKFLKDLKDRGITITIFDVLTNADTLFRFAPSPSGYLHIGHFVPIILNILLREISRKYGNKSDLVIRIDDTNPEDDDFSVDIMNTLNNVLGNDYKDFITTRSSDKISDIIRMIDTSIKNNDGKFYVDLTDQEILRVERANRIENSFRNMDNVMQLSLWDKMKSLEIKHAVIRAKINMKSDNGNLRDPIMIRIVKNEFKQDVLMPTYDLVCPVLDSIDSNDNEKICIGLRDANYYDRLEQYYWVQNALKLKPTIIVTFSRVNFAGALLSKRKIKKLISSGKVKEWSDPRLMTIDGIFNKGMTLGGILNFYWICGHISVGNRDTLQAINTLFDANDKILSQKSNFIVDRMPVKFIPIDINDNVYIKIRIIQNILSPHISNISDSNVSANCESDTDNEQFLDYVHLNDVYCKKDKLIACNVKHINELVGLKDLTIDDLEHGTELFIKYNLDKTKFKICSDINIGETIKINNFKDIPDDPNFGGYYKVIATYPQTLEVLHIYA
jgi:glutamyl/glutaminyl-tRNA synthetase